MLQIEGGKILRISAKGRYALAACIDLAQQYEEDQLTTVISIAEKLDISKIYLEQVFSLLKRGEVVLSIKGSHGGYKLTRHPDQISVLDVLASIETAIFETIKDTVSMNAKEIEVTMQECVFNLLDEAVSETLKNISLSFLLEETKKRKKGTGYMFYI